MRVFFDTNVLVAAFEKSHAHHARAKPCLARACSGADDGFLGLHSIAEFFAVMTRLPLAPRIHPHDAARMLNQVILTNLQAVTPTQEDYVTAVAATSEAGFSGGRIYDALLLQAAVRSQAQRIFTFNVEHFLALAPSGMRDRIAAP